MRAVIDSRAGLLRAAIVAFASLCIGCSDAAFETSEQPSRVADGLVAYYPFTDGDGLVVRDDTSVSQRLDLTISGPESAVEWLAPNGIAISEPASLSTGVAEKVHEAIAGADGSGAFTMELWASTDDLGQTFPARMLSYGLDGANANVLLGQELDAIVVRVRTAGDATNDGGKLTSDEEPIQAAGVVGTTATHYVATYEADALSLYVDASLVARVVVAGGLKNWDAGYSLTLANEASGDRSWLGKVYQAAIYDRALSGGEVTQNFEQGEVVD